MQTKVPLPLLPWAGRVIPPGTYCLSECPLWRPGARYRMLYSQNIVCWLVIMSGLVCNLTRSLCWQKKFVFSWTEMHSKRQTPKFKQGYSATGSVGSWCRLTWINQLHLRGVHLRHQNVLVQTAVKGPSQPSGWHASLTEFPQIRLSTVSLTKANLTTGAVWQAYTGWRP